MNHIKVVYIANRTTLNLGHRKFAVDTPLTYGLRYIYCKLAKSCVFATSVTAAPSPLKLHTSYRQTK